MIAGPTEMAVLFALVVLLFGAQKIPQIANSMGRSTKEYHAGREEVELEIKRSKSE